MIINSVACMQKNSKKFENCVGFSTSRSERVNEEVGAEVGTRKEGEKKERGRKER